MYEMTYVSPDGASFALTGGQIEVAEGGVDKLVGSVLTLRWACRDSYSNHMSLSRSAGH